MDSHSQSSESSINNLQNISFYVPLKRFWNMRKGWWFSFLGEHRKKPSQPHKHSYWQNWLKQWGKVKLICKVWAALFWNQWSDSPTVFSQAVPRWTEQTWSLLLWARTPGTPHSDWERHTEQTRHVSLRRMSLSWLHWSQDYFWNGRMLRVCSSWVVPLVCICEQTLHTLCAADSCDALQLLL